MVLKILTDTESFAYQDIDRTFCRTRSAGGMMYLQFDMSVKHELYKYVREETRLEFDGQRYIVKGINERTKAIVATINAELDLTGLSNKVYTEKTFSTRSFHSLCTDILSGTGWTIVDDDLVARRTTTEATDKTPRQILEQCTNATAYNTCYAFDSINKVIHVITPYENTDSCGTYFTDELNLQEVTFKGSSSGLVTRLYPIGKDGLTIESVNGGKAYLDDFSYTTDVIAQVWRDERYTNAQKLMDDGIVNLRALAHPVRSYTCKILDLAKTKPEIYGSHLAFDLYDVITLIDRNRQTNVDHRIVEIKEYPSDHTLDTVTLSSIAGRIIGKLDTLQNRITELDAQTLHDRTKVNEIKQDLDTTVLHVSESWASSVNETWFTQTSEGLFLETSKMLGSTKWSSLLEQSYNAVRISWNNSSRYISFESTGEIIIYDSPYAKSQANPTKRASFDYEGCKYYHGDNKKVGKIGTNAWYNNPDYRGLVFDLEKDAGYMCWAARDTPTGTYSYKLAYFHNDRYETQIIDGESKSVLAQKKGLYFATDTYTKGYLYLEDNYNIAQINGGGVAYAGSFSFGTRTANSNGGYDYSYGCTFQGKNISILGNANFTVYNNANVNFYSNINMHGFDIIGESDIRLKKNIAPTQINALDVLNALELKEFDWCENDEHVPIGIIAQQLREVAPELIETSKSGLLSIKTSSLIYYAIKAIQELSGQIENLQAGTYNGTSYTKAPLDLSQAGTWDHAAEIVGVGSGNEIIHEAIPLPISSNDTEDEEV